MTAELLMLFTLHSNTYHLPTKLLESVCYIESKYDVKAVHHDDGGEDSLGVCQIKLSTAKWLGFKGNRRQLMSPSVNIEYAARYLRRQLDRYKNVTKAIISYNRGNAKHLTRTKYSDKVKKKWRQLL